MPRTVTIEIPDEFSPQLDRVLARWIKEGKAPELTLWNALRHGLDIMDVPERQEPWNLHPDSSNDLGDDIPF
jgi:hypothetical protein